MLPRARFLLLGLALVVAGCAAAPEEASGEDASARDATPDPDAPAPEDPAPTSPASGGSGDDGIVVGQSYVVPRAATGLPAEPSPPVAAGPMPDPATGPMPQPAPTPVASEPAPPPASTPTPPPATQPAATPPPPPAPVPPSAPAAWPADGSFVRYSVRYGQSFGGSDQFTQAHANLTWTWQNGDWTGECVGEQRHDMDGDGVVETVPVSRTYDASDPPHWPLLNTRSPPAEGEPVDAWIARGCALEMETWPYLGTSTRPTTAEGASRIVAAHVAGGVDMPYDFRTEWSASHGLVLEWSLWKAGSAPSSASGMLTDTDAPMR